MKSRSASICALANGAAALALATVLAPGVSLAPTPSAAAYVAENLGAWRSGWALWIVAAISLLPFFRWWASVLRWPSIARVAVALAAVGVAADIVAEARLIAWSPGQPFDAAGPLRQSGIVANGLYSVAGGLLTRATLGLPRRLAQWSWTVWTLGIGLAVAVAIGSDAASFILTAALFALLVPWLVVFGRRLR
ncbi:MAG: hypothetical protein ACYC9W_01725 [Candidatus Limnocylindria bacterium]